MSRSGKWYRKNEAEVMKSLGFKPTPNSGSGWVSKEDGENNYALCQLKSTDADSIRIQKKDLHTLEYNAAISHKIPVFAIQFIQGNETWLMVKPEDLGALQAISEGMQKTQMDEYEAIYSSMFKSTSENVIQSSERMKERIESSKKAREKFRKEVETKYKKKERNAYQWPLKELK